MLPIGVMTLRRHYKAKAFRLTLMEFGEGERVDERIVAV
jgi:hypothetical protein